MSSPLLPELSGRCRFPEGHLHLAVSGGADSLALLALAAETGQTLTAHHVDHGLRSGSALEADVVAAAADRFRASFEAHQVEVGNGPNLEARARAARYGVLPPGTLTGHTADDQAETMLVNLLRGAALDGLAGMPPANKPLLGIRRSETHGLCADLGLTPVVDASNSDTRFIRNRIRSEVLPLLVDVAGRDVVPILTRQAELFRQDSAFLDEQASSIDVTDAAGLATASAALAGRAVRQWLRRHLDDEQHPPDVAAVNRVLAVARGEAVACDINGGWEVRRSAQRLHLQLKKT